MHPDALQSYPAFLDGFFTGIEFPIGATRLEGEELVVAHQPGWRLTPDTWFTSRTAVFGVAKLGEERKAFERYITAHHLPVNRIRTSYNLWYTASYDMGGSPLYTEDEIVGYMNTIAEKFHKPYGAAFDTAIIEYGWSKKQSVWEFDELRFPNGLGAYRQAAEQAGSKLGMWISPSSLYPAVQDGEWAASHGYETYASPPWPVNPLRVPCLAGPRYRAYFKDFLARMVSGEGLRHFKLDGYLFTCPESNHGHEPGALSAEALADGLIEAFNAAHAAAPGVWLETTCLTQNPSPWWLFHADSVVGCYGDDNCFGRGPSPVYRDSLTTSRDFHNLQGADRLPIPIAFQQVMGLNHFTDEDLMNDAVTCVMRGNMFLPVYVNPLYMTDRRWKNLASLLAWANANISVLLNTSVLLPAAWRETGSPELGAKAVMPLEPYGYSHWDGERGLVMIRNPWIRPQTYSLKLDHSTGVPEGANGLSAISLYPESRVYGQELGYDCILDIPVAPYETVVLSIGQNQPLQNSPDVTKVIGGRITAGKVKYELTRFDMNPDVWGEDLCSMEGALGKESATGRLKTNTFINKLSLTANITVEAPEAQLVVYMEGGDKTPPKYAYTLTVNGMDFTMDPFPSKTKSMTYNVSHLQGPHWLFLTTPLPLLKFMTEGKNNIQLDLLCGDDCVKASAWVWASRKTEDTPPIPGALPSPESISLDAVALFEADLK